MSWERWRELCRVMPDGHRHCRHGHVQDCPAPMTCELIPLEHEPTTFLVMAGPTVWLFGGAKMAEHHVDVLNHCGAEVTYRPNISAAQARRYIQRLPEYRGRVIEDVRPDALREMWDGVRQ